MGAGMAYGRVGAAPATPGLRGLTLYWYKYRICRILKYAFVNLSKQEMQF